jgi:hypothetical protein
MKVLYLHNESLDSKMANLVQVKAMCKAMSENGMDVTLSIPGNNPAAANKNRRKIKTYLMHCYLRKPLINIPKIDKYINFPGVRNAIKQIDPDLIYLRSPLMLKQVIGSKKPIIIELHNSQLHQGYNCTG